MIDLEKIRKDTPHCGGKLFFNSAGSSLPPRIVTKRVISYLEEEDKLGGYFVAEKRKEEIDGFYEHTAELLKTQPDHIAFTFNATDSYARALSSIPFDKGDVILTTDDDYISNHIAFLNLQKRFGINVIRGKLDKTFDLDLEDFESQMIRFRPKLVAVTHMPTNSGKVQNAELIGNLCAKHDLMYLVDACQSAGQLALDVNKINCDFLSATGRKFLRGPRGTGFLYVSDRVLEMNFVPLSLDMRGAKWKEMDQYQLYPGARRFEMWEFPYALLVGLSEAIKYANEIGMDQIEQYTGSLSGTLRNGLQNLSGVEIYDHGSHLGSIVTFRKEGISLKKMRSYLNENNVFYSISARGNALIDFNRKGVAWVVRISPHYFNTHKEVEQLIKIIDQL